MTVAPDRLTLGALPSGDEGKMSLSGFKAKLKLLASIFHKNQDPPPQLTLHCNIKFVFKEKLTMKRDSLREEKLECSLWCCLSDPSPQGPARPLLSSGKAHCTLVAAVSSAIEVVDM
uniref:uncharacterized protein LOC100425484 isoform X4 n=1 Tax=Macaca mulatta TaxID=9544 RepID=UPI0007326D9F|nr:uncharacterized protein LOC100425484 isoform X4 [Macaca mulatta]XP_028707868.1 uncharacterized protein LOC100425484 isoform X4 [Macaca mulatta]XP_028707869.1 uncharacterized protein LOC100425484 isoform X4 [Macaca mulatta]